MDYTTLVNTIATIAGNNPKQATMIWGPPGCGKSHAATQGLPKALGIPLEAVRMFRPSNHDPVDVTGLPVIQQPTTEDGVVRTTWVTPDFLHEVNALAEQHGRAVFVLDELNQSTPMMFNALNGILLDRCTPNWKAHDGVIIVATGNRQTDRAASNRMPSHTSNRVWHGDMESDLKGWVRWAMGAGLPMWVVAFLQFRPGLLNAFDPDKRENPTERTWEMVARAAGRDLPSEMTLPLAKGFVGEGPAAELSAFRRVMEQMPNPDGVLLDPSNAPIPEGPSAMFAMCGAMAERASKAMFENIITYVSRMPTEFTVLAVRNCYQNKPEISQTRAFIEWVSANPKVFNDGND